tara:strand:+ start:265 stop:588 length:324 start_codon:yes stop_codon:yes gene_type:complete
MDKKESIIDPVIKGLARSKKDAERQRTDQEEIWEATRGILVASLYTLFITLLLLNILDIEYELLGMPITYASVVICLPLIFFCGLVILVGDHKFRDSFNKAWEDKKN